MSDRNEFNVYTEDPTTEVEMSAQELLELSSSREIESLEHCATQSGAGAPAKESVSATAQPAQSVHTQAAATSADRRISASRVALALSCAVAAVMVVVGTLYQYSTPDRPVQSSMATVLQKAAQFERSVATSDSERPVRFTNPFDAGEVFEFPPGTSEAEARDGAADILRKRALERQAQLNARLSRPR